MITLYQYKEFYNTKATEKLSLKCEYCGKEFKVIKRRIQAALRQHGRNKCNFCSKSCSIKSRTKYTEIECILCGKKVLRKNIHIKKNKSGKTFCSKKCSTTYFRKIIQNSNSTDQQNASKN